MDDEKELREGLGRCFKEINIWRDDFLQERFCSPPFKFIPQEDKDFIRTTFSAIPSDAFSSPWEEWNNCISFLLQRKTKS